MQLQVRTAKSGYLYISEIENGLNELGLVPSIVAVYGTREEILDEIQSLRTALLTAASDVAEWLI